MEKLKARLAEVDGDIKKLSDERTSLRNKIATMSTPFKVGDRITTGRRDCVYQITAILPGWSATPKLMGAKIKKDGTTGAVSTELYYEWGKPGFALAGQQ